jgi:hypothetical protein
MASGSLVALYIFLTKNRAASSRKHALDRARMHYMRIHPKVADPEVRIPFLQSLLSLCPGRIVELVDRFCDLLHWYDDIHPRFLALLWEIVLKYGEEVPVTAKAKLLSALRQRLATFDKKIQESTLLSSSLESGGETSCSNMADADGSAHAPLVITDVAAMLTSVIFRATWASPQQSVYRWLINQGLGTFAPGGPIEVQWSHLVLMASFNAPSNSGEDHLGIVPPSSSFVFEECMNWRAVFTLSTLEKAFGHRTASPATQAQDANRIRETIRGLWPIWSVAAAKQHHPVVIRAIVASFLRLSGLVGDVSLKDACLQFCSSHHLWLADHLSDLEISQTKHLMAEYMFASVLCGQKDWPGLFSSLDSLVLQWRSDIAMMLIMRLLKHDVVVAHQAFAFCDQVEDIQITSPVLLSLSMCLAKQNLLDLAIPLLRDTRLSPCHHQALTAAVLCALLRKRTGCSNPKLTAILADSLQRSYKTSLLPPTLQKPMQHVLLIMAKSDHPSKAVAIIKGIHDRSPSYFSPRFYALFLRQLVKLGQFRLAAHVYMLLEGTYPNKLGQWRDEIILGLVKRGASTLARQVNSSARDQMGRSQMELSARALAFQLRKPSRARALKAVAILTRSPMDGPSIRLAVQILVRVQRPLAARKLFERTKNELDSQTRTAIGNIILHGALLRPSVRNRQQVRKVLHTLGSLVKQHGFVPDQVTANILLKAMLRWSTRVDSGKLRALFGSLVKVGYLPGDRSTGGGLSSRGPFSLPDGIQLPGLPGDASFEKHVRPLYKMFIKAFQLRDDVDAATTVTGYLQAEESTAREGRRSKEIKG